VPKGAGAKTKHSINIKSDIVITNSRKRREEAERAAQFHHGVDEQESLRLISLHPEPYRNEFIITANFIALGDPPAAAMKFIIFV
jgi:hypothetical protein